MKTRIFVKVESLEGDTVYMDTPSFEINERDIDAFVETIQRAIDRVVIIADPPAPRKPHKPA